MIRIHSKMYSTVTAGDRLNIKMSSHQYMDPHVKEKSNLYNMRIPYPGKRAFILRRGSDSQEPIGANASAKPWLPWLSAACMRNWHLKRKTKNRFSLSHSPQYSLLTEPIPWENGPIALLTKYRFWFPGRGIKSVHWGVIMGLVLIRFNVT